MRRRATSPAGRDGFTLVELLAVIVIVTLVAGATAMNLGVVRSAAALADAVGACHRIDGLARLHARRNGPVTLATGVDETELTARDARTGEIVGRVVCPAGVRVSLAADDPRRPIVLDRTGAGPDYVLRLATDERDRAWYVCGLTGRFIDEGARP